MDSQTYSKNFKNIYNKFKLASSEDQKTLLIDFLQYLLLGYDKKYIDIKDVGAWCTSAHLVAKASNYKNKMIMVDLEKIGYNYGDSFDMGEQFVIETWNMSWDSAEKELIKRIRKIVEKFNNY